MAHKDPLVDLLIHDLTGPLTIVSTSINNLLKKEEKHGPYNDYQKEVLKRALRNAEKAKGMLQDIVEVYRSEEGCFRKDRFLMREVLHDALQDAVEVIKPDLAEELSRAKNGTDFERILQENGIFFTVKGIHASTPFSHDQKKIRQIIRNLISNALKHHRKRITLALSGETDLICSVQDDGEGIPDSIQAGVFKRFRDLSETKDEDAAMAGFGFGLSCVKDLIEAMKGEISLESVEGAGCCFTVRIPPLEKT